MKLFILGVLIGWLTKIPWFYKRYKELLEEKKANQRMRDYLKKETK